MCNASCIDFARTALSRSEIWGKSILEVGALDVNGSVRGVIEAHGPRSYLGVDIEHGPGVDELCDVTELAEHYGESAFDVVVATELVEHVRDWRAAVSNLKRVLAPGGVMLITTRSKGFPIHGYPLDYWRYEPADMRSIFASWQVLRLERDPEAPGVFVKVRKPDGQREDTDDLATVQLYSVIARRRLRGAGRWIDLALVPARLVRWTRPLRNKAAVRTRLGRLRSRDG